MKKAKIILIISLLLCIFSLYSSEDLSVTTCKDGIYIKEKKCSFVKNESKEIGNNKESKKHAGEKLDKSHLVNNLYTSKQQEYLILKEDLKMKYSDLPKKVRENLIAEEKEMFFGVHIYKDLPEAGKKALFSERKALILKNLPKEKGDYNEK